MTIRVVQREVMNLRFKYSGKTWRLTGDLDRCLKEETGLKREVGSKHY